MAITNPGRTPAEMPEHARVPPAGVGLQREVDLALASAYRTFAREHPRWVQARFDEHFLHSRVASLLAAHGNDVAAVTPEVVVQLWAGQRGWFNDQARREAMQALRPAAEQFLRVLASAME